MAGVDVTATLYLHTIHDFLMLNAINRDPQPQPAFEQAADFLRDHLEVDPTPD